MPALELSFASKQDSLSVRDFSVRERISGLFEVDVIARSELDEIDLDTIVGHGAAFKIVTGLVHSLIPSRVWTGVCSHMEQVHPEPSRIGQKALSTYYLRIVPGLWRTTLRKNSRIFQHKSIPDIVKEVLAEWEIVPELKLEEYPSLEYRVQYGETDFDFVNRLLEEAGISFLFEFEEGETKMVLIDKPHKAEGRPGKAIHFVDNPNREAEQEFLTHVHLAHQVRPGRFTIRDFDFRTKPDVELLGHAKAKIEEERYEQYDYAPGAFLVEPARDDAPVANDPGSRFDEGEAEARATRSLEAIRRDRRTLSFQTNVLDLSPGTIFRMDRHPRRDLSSDKRLLVTERVMEGTPGGEWRVGGTAVFADDPYRPAPRTPKPRIYGVQSALVVGPPGDEEIYTDEFGRVRVQFHWDRLGQRDHRSSCWIRVSHGWAGASYGMIAIPRVGQEVLVEFFEGDPDCPVVVGRVYNNTTRVPYKLPEHKTRSGWKSDSSKGSDGFNELMFEDAKGQELVSIQAQRNLAKVVKVDEIRSIGSNRAGKIGQNDSLEVGANQRLSVKTDRAASIGHDDTTNVGVRHLVQVGEVTGTQTTNQRIVITTGNASIVLEGDTIRLDAANIVVTAGSSLVVHGGEVAIDGKPMVRINCGQALPPRVQTLPTGHLTGPNAPDRGDTSTAADRLLTAGSGFDDPGGFDRAEVPPDPPDVFDIVATPPESPRAAPPAVKMDGAVSEQIGRDAESQPADAAPTRAVLVANKATKALELAQIAKDAITDHGIASLTAAGQAFLGPVMSKPIGALGGLSGGDIAGVMNAGSSLGVFHFGGGKAAGEAASAPAPGSSKQFMALRTASAPPKVDGAKLDAQKEAYASTGMSQDASVAKAMEQQGLVLYQGDHKGTFTRVPA